MEKRNCRSSRAAIHCDNCEKVFNHNKTGNGRRIGKLTALNINLYIESPISKVMTRKDSSISNRNSCQPTTGDRSESHTLLSEDPRLSGSTTWPRPSNPSQELVESLQQACNTHLSRCGHVCDPPLV
jgi:hypothetical protein